MASFRKTRACGHGGWDGWGADCETKPISAA